MQGPWENCQIDNGLQGQENMNLLHFLLFMEMDVRLWEHDKYRVMIGLICEIMHDQTHVCGKTTFNSTYALSIAVNVIVKRNSAMEP